MAVTHRFQTSSFAKIGDREHTPVSFTVFSPPTIREDWHRPLSWVSRHCERRCEGRV